MKNNRIYLNSVNAIIVRLLSMFVLLGICRSIFYLYNHQIIGELASTDLWGIFQGAFVYDSASIFYINIPFILLSLSPFRNRVDVKWQKVISWVYIIPNAIGLLVNILDTFSYPYTQRRFTFADISFQSEDSLIGGYWWGILLWIILCILLYNFCFKYIRVEKRYRLTYNITSYNVSQVIVLLFFAVFTLFAIRGYSLSGKRSPLSLSDTRDYVRPELGVLIQSNPFSVISTICKKNDSQ